MPAERSRNRDSHDRFLRPYSATETKSSAPATTAQRAMVTMWIRG
jgi:hypothetical protein